MSAGQVAKGAGRRLRGAFTLIELMIVVVILGILAAVVLPKVSDASQEAAENTLKDDLRYLRTQVVVFKAQHKDVPPGYPNGDRGQAPTAEAFVSQMTQASDALFNLGVPSATRKFGPYLSKMPANPLNRKNTVTVVPDGGSMPPAGLPDNSTGWIYKPQTMEILPNSPGTDRDGVRYIDY